MRETPTDNQYFKFTICNSFSDFALIQITTVGLPSILDLICLRHPRVHPAVQGLRDTLHKKSDSVLPTPAPRKLLRYLQIPRAPAEGKPVVALKDRNCR